MTENVTITAETAAVAAEAADQSLHVRDIPVVEGKQLRTVITAACLGNAVEWYDFSVYGYLAIIIGKVFFSAAPASIQTILALVTFSIPFLVRPLGAGVFGYLGDKYGRKHVLSFTIILISISTFAIGLIPSYASIGLAAPILILIAKIMQGLSVGGEYAGAMTFVAEYSPDRKRGFLASWLDFGSVAGFLFGILVVFVVTQLVGGQEVMNDWGWRVPFLLSLPLGFIGLYLRRQVDESPAFQQQEEKGDDDERSALKIIRANSKNIILCCCFVVMTNVAYYMLLVYVPTYLSEVVRFSRDKAEIITIIIMAGMLVVQPCIGYLSDKIGRKPFIIIGSLGYLFLSLPAFHLLQRDEASYIYGGLAILALLLCCLNSIQASVLPALFPTKVRLRTLGISFNISVFIAGITPPLAAYLVGSRDISAEGLGHFWPNAPAYYLMAVALLGLVTGCIVRETAGRPLKGALPIASSRQEAREVFKEHLDHIEERVSNLDEKISELEERRQDLINKHPNLS